MRQYYLNLDWNKILSPLKTLWNSFPLAFRRLILIGGPFLLIIGMYTTLVLSVDWQQRLYKSVIDGNIKKAKTALFFRANVNKQIFYKGVRKLPVSWAMKLRNPEMVEFLSSKGAQMNYSFWRVGKGKLMSNTYAIDTDDPATIKAYIKAGGQIDSSSADGLSPLTYAIKYDKPNATQYLFSQIDLNSPDPSGLFPLTHVMMMKDSCEAAQYYDQLEKNGMYPYMIDTDENTALHQFFDATQTVIGGLAVYGGLSFVLTKCAENINRQNRAGMTPLLKAAKRGNAKAIDLLTKHGGSMTLKNSRGKNAFDVLAKNNHTKLFSAHAKKLKRNDPKAFKKLQKRYPNRINAKGKVLKKPLTKKRIVHRASKRYRPRRRGGGKMLRFLGLPGRILSLFF